MMILSLKLNGLNKRKRLIMIKAIPCIQMVTGFPQYNSNRKKKDKNKQQKKKRHRQDYYTTNITFDIKM